MVKTYPLFAFSNGEVIIITRGGNLDQAFDRASESKAFRRGSTIFPLDYLPTNAAQLYSQNHDSGWLHRPMKWLTEKEKDNESRKTHRSRA